MESVLNIPMADFILACPDAPVRLMNAVRAAADDGTLPFETVADYLAAGHAAIDRMLKLPNLGIKSVTELDGLIQKFTKSPPSDQSRLERAVNYPAIDDNIPSDFDISLGEFLNRQARVSARLFNAIRTAVGDGTCPFQTVTEYVLAKDGYLWIRGLPNLGRGSAREFDDLVKNALRRGSIHPISSDLHIGRNGWCPNVESIMQAVFSALEPRERDILFDRIQSELTLEQVAANLSVTRERVRQIESSALQRLRRTFAQTLQECITALCNKLAQTGINQCSLAEFAEIALCEIATAQLLFKLAKRLNLENVGHIVLMESHVILADCFCSRQEWNTVIKRAVMSSSWPLELDALAERCDLVPRFFLEQCLVDRYSARITNGRFEIRPCLSTADMCIHVLLKAGKPLHISEIRALVKTYFGKSIPEHVVNATVGRLKEVTIADPGTYVHYACLSYSDQVLANIRNEVHRHLSEQNCFIGSKVLFDRLFAKHASAYPEGFNHYLMMGIVQDDSSFVTKRGNMVGLASFDVEKTYISLEDEVRNIVLNEGPISIPEIVARLAVTRKLCNDCGIRLILSNTPTIIQVGPRTYGSLHQFFTSRAEYDDICTALQVNLLSKPKSAYALSQQLISFGFTRASTEVVESLINAMDDVIKLNDAYMYTPVQPELCQFRDITNACITDGVGHSALVERLQEHMSAELVGRLIRFDYRLSGSSDDHTETSSTSELISILDEFDF